jgi:hypothetical protein
MRTAATLLSHRARNDVAQWSIHGCLPAELVTDRLSGSWLVGTSRAWNKHAGGHGSPHYDAQLSHTSPVRPGQQLRIFARSPLSINIMHGHIESISVSLRGMGSLDRFTVRDEQKGLGVHLLDRTLKHDCSEG